MTVNEHTLQCVFFAFGKIDLNVLIDHSLMLLEKSVNLYI
jgi:hypothetical protein